MLNKCFIIENTSLETAFDEISSYPSDLLDFRENALCKFSSSISSVCTTGSSYFLIDTSLYAALNVRGYV